MSSRFFKRLAYADVAAPDTFVQGARCPDLTKASVGAGKVQGIFDAQNPAPSTQHLAPTSDLLWDRIVSIEYTGYEQVYDIEVEGTHNFVANGIIAHNTFLNGNVGPIRNFVSNGVNIGTTGPAQKLHVEGQCVTGDTELAIFEVQGSRKV